MGRASRNDVTPGTPEGMRSNVNLPPALRAQIRVVWRGWERSRIVRLHSDVLPAVSRSLGAGSTRVNPGRVCDSLDGPRGDGIRKAERAQWDCPRERH
jgi:hypothetical protein